MNLLTTSKIKKSFGASVLFEDVSFGIYDHDKIGFVGVNGAGKTTLFKILLGQMPCDDGSVFKNRSTDIGYMEQHTAYSSDKTLWQEIMTVFDSVISLEKQLDDITGLLGKNPENLEQLTHAQHDLSEEFERMGGFTYKSIASSALRGIGFSEQEFSMPFEKLSGGQKTRALLCKILLGGSNLLLLDEPTNHLDINAVQWLEGFLRSYNGAFVVISHDRYFLDRVTNRTLELENQRLTTYEGNYTRYLQLKEEARAAMEHSYQNTQKEIKRIEGIIEQQRRWNREKNIKTAESKQKIVDKLTQSIQKPSDSPNKIGFQFNTATGGGNDVLMCDDLRMAFGGKDVFEHADLYIGKSDCVFLLGPNGCGKTTLFKIITSHLEPISGSVRLGANIKMSYYDQTQEHLDHSKTVIQEVHDAYPKMTQTAVRNALALFLFRADDVFKQISMLSGGEKARVSLLKLMLSETNLLLLDEPTNHLDIPSREALESALTHYTGTLLIISHDRYFINKLANKIYYMLPNRLKKYEGNYDYFLEKHNTITQEKDSKPIVSGGHDYKAQKQADADKRKRATQQKKAEDEIHSTEETLAALQGRLDLDEYAADHIKIMELCEEIDTVKLRLDELYELWEALSGNE